MSEDRLIVGRIEQLTVDKTAILQGQQGDKIAELQGAIAAATAERDSWRRVAERLDREKYAAQRENDALSMEASENLQRLEKAESDFKELSISSNARVAEGLLARSAVALAAERERREAADKILRDIRNRGVGGWVTSAIDAHFARYKKEPT